jgi:hypothetical protein
MAAQLTEVKAEEGSDVECVHDACQIGTVVRYCERRWVIADLGNYTMGSAPCEPALRCTLHQDLI